MRSICLTIVFASMASSLRCPSQWTLYQSNCYRYFSEVKSFWEASGFCRQQLFYSTDSIEPSSTSELVSIHSPEENSFVNSIVPSGVNVYIGLYHIVNAEKRTWHWADGSPFDYNNWSPGQPDASLQPYGLLWNTNYPSQWDDGGGDLSFTCKMPADDCLTSPYESVNEDDDCKNDGNYRAGICVCPSPYFCIDCSWYNGCWSNPCQNGGKCINQEQSYSCECDDGFNGTHCELYKGCWSNPCQNGGKCINQEQSYSCECDDGYNGTHCEMYKGSSKEVSIAAFGAAVGTLVCSVVILLVIIAIICKRKQTEEVNKPTEDETTDPENDNNYETPFQVKSSGGKNNLSENVDDYMGTTFVPEKMYTSLETVHKH